MEYKVSGQILTITATKLMERIELLRLKQEMEKQHVKFGIVKHPQHKHQIHAINIPISSVNIKSKK